MTLLSPRLDPRARLLCAILFCAAAACPQSVAASGAALVFAVIFLGISGVAPLMAMRRLVAANFFIAFIWLVTPWTTPGQAVWSMGFFTITKEGLRLSLLVTLKANAIVCFFMAMIEPVSVSAAGAALYQLRCPDKLVWLFLLMGANMRILEREWHDIFEAAKLRGFAPACNALTYRTLASILAILLIRSHERGEKMYEAMLLRGFSGRLPYCGDLVFGWRDAALGVITAILCATLWLVESANA